MLAVPQAGHMLGKSYVSALLDPGFNVLGHCPPGLAPCDKEQDGAQCHKKTAAEFELLNINNVLEITRLGIKTFD
jgi:hypothetical protein